MKRVISLSFVIIILVNVNFSQRQISNIEKLPELDKKTREVIVKKIAKLLKENYVSEKKGYKMADHIRKQLMKGFYNNISEMKKLAQILTVELLNLSKDRHLAVIYNPSKVVELKTEQKASDEDDLKEIEDLRFQRQRVDNFGFKRVEILQGNIGYLDLRFFSETDYAASTAIGAINFLAHTDAIIIDLRNNFGGGASMSQFLASYFLPIPPVQLSAIHSRLDNSTRQFWTLPYVPGQRLTEVELYILTSDRTFSAAEQFCYDLKQLKRAIIIGEQTVGGAHMVTRMVVNEYVYVIMPFAGAKNPITKKNWEGNGVKPHVRVPAERALRMAYLMALKSLAEKSKYKNWRKYLNSLIKDFLTRYKK